MELGVRTFCFDSCTPLRNSSDMHSFSVSQVFLARWRRSTDEKSSIPKKSSSTTLQPTDMEVERPLFIKERRLPNGSCLSLACDVFVRVYNYNSFAQCETEVPSIRRIRSPNISESKSEKSHMVSWDVASGINPSSSQDVNFRANFRSSKQKFLGVLARA